MKRIRVLFVMVMGIGESVSSRIHQSNTHAAAALRKLIASDVPATAKVISDAFPHSSPHSWGRALGLPEGRMEGYMAGYLLDPIEQGYCFGISEEKGNEKEEGGGGRLLSIIITEEFDPWKKEKEKEKDAETEKGGASEHGDAGVAAAAESYLAIDGILNDCKGLFLQELHKRGVPQTLSARCGYVAWMATSEEARGKGHAFSLVKRATEEMMSKKNFAVAYCVSPCAARVFVKNGYSCWGKIPYASWRFNGKKPFAVLPDEISIMVKQRDVGV